MKKENYYENVSNVQATIRRLFRRTNRGLEIGNGEVILIEGDVQIRSLREGINALKTAREKLDYCLNRIRHVDKIKEKATTGDISGGTAEDIEDRLGYISRLMKATDKAIEYLDIPQILEKDAVSAIHELVDLVTGGHSALPITFTVCEEYTI